MFGMALQETWLLGKVLVVSEESPNVSRKSQGANFYRLTWSGGLNRKIRCRDKSLSMPNMPPGCRIAQQEPCTGSLITLVQQSKSSQYLRFTTDARVNIVLRLAPELGTL